MKNVKNQNGQNGQNSPKLTIFGIFNELLSTQRLKITEKVSFNIASEASYVYILSGQKFIENAKNSQFWRVFGK